MVTFFYGEIMGKTNYSYEKRKRELDKQKKKEEKLKKKQLKKEMVDNPGEFEIIEKTEDEEE